MLGRVISQAVTWGTTLIVIRILTPEDYGLIALSAAFISFFTLVSESGLGPALIQAKTLTDDKIREIHGLVVICCVAIIGILLLLAPAISSVFSEPRLQLILSVLAVVFVLEAFLIVPRNLLIRDMRFKRLAIVEMVAQMSAGLGSLLFALNGFGVWSLVFGNIIAVTCRVIGVNLASRYRGLPRFRLRNVRTEIRFGGGILVLRLLAWLFGHMDVFIIGKLFSTATLGAYSVAFNLASMPQQKLSQIMNQVSLSGFSKVQDDREKLLKYLRTAISYLLILVVPVFFGISAIAPEIVHLILGDKWSAALFPLTILPIMLPLRMATGPIFESINATGRPFLTCRLILNNIVVLAVALMVGSNWGIDGVCVSWLVATPISLVMNLLLVRPVIGFGLPDLLAVLWRPLLAAIAMYAAVVAARSYFPVPLGDLAACAMLVLTGAAVYSILILLLARQKCMELFQFVRG
ncbi:MAG: lipopolysaccharide biosynthesis protein [Alphaproteobacteria bacterium]